MQKVAYEGEMEIDGLERLTHASRVMKILRRSARSSDAWESKADTEKLVYIWWFSNTFLMLFITSMKFSVHSIVSHAVQVEVQTLGSQIKFVYDIIGRIQILLLETIPYFFRKTWKERKRNVGSRDFHFATRGTGNLSRFKVFTVTAIGKEMPTN